MGDQTNAFRDAYDKTTGAKLPHRVPEAHFSIFPNLRKTPMQRASEARTDTSVAPTQAAEANEMKEK